MLISYHGIVKKGRIQLQEPVTLPEGAEVLIVISPPESLEYQKRRLDALSAEEWQASFDAFIEVISKEATEINIDSVSDQELVDIVHQVRGE